ncbi:MAG: hypothetical protein AAF513_03600 [Pseudomonadota bacterium]
MSPQKYALLPYALCAALLLLASGAQADINALTGTWMINQDETDKVRVPIKDRGNVLSNNVRGSVYVGGVPIPIPGAGGGQRAMSSMSAQDPKVLRSASIQIEAPQGKKLTIQYDQGGKETLVRGDYRGRDSKWGRNKIEQKYKTTERTVTKRWSLRKDGRLFVSVVIKPKGDRKRIYNRVFDRVIEAEADDETS